MRRLALLAVLAVAAVPSARADETTCTDNPVPPPNPRIVRGTLDGLHFNVLVPSDYATDTTRRYPVLWLLHGGDYNENNWLDQTDVLQFTAPFTGDAGVIVVMPDGGPMGQYTDWESGNQQWETYHLRHLLPYIDRNFRTIPDRGHRAIAGFSYGGLGAMEYPARQPDLFSIAGSFSGFVHNWPPDEPYTGPSPVEDRKGRGHPGAPRKPPPPTPYKAPTDAESGCGGSGSAFGDPVSDDVATRAHDPTDLAGNLRDATVWVGAGNAIPCPGEPDPPPHGLLQPIEPFLHKVSQDFDAALTAAHVAHTTDIDGCGMHDMINGQRELHLFWPIMAAAWGRPKPARFSIRRVEPVFRVYGWTFVADAKRAREFLEVTGASRRGLTLAGSGTETVTTPRFFRRGQRVRVGGAAPAVARAGRSGRIRVAVDLGPAHTTQQFTPGAQQEPFVRRHVTFRAL